MLLSLGLRVPGRGIQGSGFAGYELGFTVLGLG